MLVTLRRGKTNLSHIFWNFQQPQPIRIDSIPASSIAASCWVHMKHSAQSEAVRDMNERRFQRPYANPLSAVEVEAGSSRCEPLKIARLARAGA